MLKQHQKHLKQALHVGLILAGVMVIVTGMRGAEAQDVTQGYATDGPLQNGVVVRIKPDDKAKVEPLTQEKESEMFGVVVSSTESPLSISDPDETQVFVANLGRYEVLVSTQNGQIAKGDGIVISSVKGVGMKADDLHRILVGKALQNFSDNSDAVGHAKLSDGRTVALGRIKVDISVARNPAYSGDTIAGVPHAIAKVAHSVTDKPVTALRIYACLAVLLLCLFVAGAILYAGVHTAMTSVGRNPLAKKSIWKHLVTVTLLALIVVSISLIAVYLILTI